VSIDLAPRPLPWKWTHCATCSEYAGIRAAAIARAIVDKSRSTGEDKGTLIDRLMAGVHARHLAGLSILPRASS
jgi:hypothetical protein